MYISNRLIVSEPVDTVFDDGTAKPKLVLVKQNIVKAKARTDRFCMYVCPIEQSVGQMPYLSSRVYHWSNAVYSEDLSSRVLTVVYKFIWKGVHLNLPVPTAPHPPFFQRKSSPSLKTPCLLYFPNEFR